MSARQDQPLSVCLVEDELRLRELLVREITAIGYAGEGFRTAEEAWPELLADRFDVVILDLNLPGMSGMDLFKRLREAELNTAVVILTGFGTFESAVQALRWEAVDFLTKPCTLADLETVLARLDLQRQLDVRASVTADLTSAPHAESPTASTAAFTLEQREREHILATLREHQGNKSAAARALGISLRTLYNKLHIYRVQGYMP